MWWVVGGGGGVVMAVVVPVAVVVVVWLCLLVIPRTLQCNMLHSACKSTLHIKVETFML